MLHVHVITYKHKISVVKNRYILKGNFNTLKICNNKTNQTTKIIKKKKTGQTSMKTKSQASNKNHKTKKKHQKTHTHYFNILMIF